MSAGPDFDVGALYRALDVERRARGLSWQLLALEISSQFDGSKATAISPGTLSGMLERRVVEGDGVLQMLRWLDRTPESFVPGSRSSSSPDAALPAVGRQQILRFDARAIHAALDAKREERDITWQQVAAEIEGVNASSLTRLAKGGRVHFPDVMRVVRWLDRPAATFTRASRR